MGNLIAATPILTPNMIYHQLSFFLRFDLPNSVFNTITSNINVIPGFKKASDIIGACFDSW